MVVMLVHHDHPGLFEHRRELVRAVDVPVVVAEHRQHGDLQITHRVGHDRGLLGLAVGGEVAGQEHEVGALVQPREGLRRAGAVVGALAVMDVAGGGDPDPALVMVVGRPALGDDGRAHALRLPAHARWVAMGHGHG